MPAAVSPGHGFHGGTYGQCPLGTYGTGGPYISSSQTPVCMACPTGMTTPAAGADEEADCRERLSPTHTLAHSLEM
jgi:hypothetical protein